MQWCIVFAIFVVISISNAAKISDSAKILDSVTFSEEHIMRTDTSGFDWSSVLFFPEIPLW